jgi:adenylyltransferase/sulfurtransferase
VDLTNLNRQVLHWDKDIGGKKVGSAKEKLQGLNPGVRIEAIEDTISDENVLDLIADCDLIVDALDNFSTRYLLNRAALEKNIPFCHGAVYGFEGRVMTTIPGKSACFRCLYKKGSPAFKFPVIGVAPAIIGCIQATEAIKYLVGIGKLLTDRLLVYDGLSMMFNKMKLKKDPDCEDCAQIKGD